LQPELHLGGGSCVLDHLLAVHSWTLKRDPKAHAVEQCGQSVSDCGGVATSELTGPDAVHNDGLQHGPPCLIKFLGNLSQSLIAQSGPPGIDPQHPRVVVACARNELAHDTVEALPGRPATACHSAGLRDVGLGLGPEHLGEQDVLGGEVVVDETATDIGGFGHVGHASVGEPPLKDHLPRCREQLGPALLDLLTATCLRGSGTCHAR
jgi:hypothetical protein